MRSEFRRRLGPKFTRKFGFLHRIANSNTLCLLNSPLSDFSARSSEHCGDEFKSTLLVGVTQRAKL